MARGRLYRAMWLPDASCRAYEASRAITERIKPCLTSAGARATFEWSRGYVRPYGDA